MIKKKRKGRRIILFIMSTSIIIMLMVMFWQWLTERRAGFVHYPEFGISIPRNYSIHGIDVSKYQGTINWQSVKEMNVDDIRIELPEDAFQGHHRIRVSDLKQALNRRLRSEAHVI